MTIVKFNCTSFSASNSYGVTSIEAEVQDCTGILLDLAKKLGIDNVRQILFKATKTKIKNADTPVDTLVDFLVPYDKQLETQVPERAIQVYRRELQKSKNTHLGKHPSTGFFVLSEKNLVWCER